eukprot:TRINITY_DN14604_c0_g4_i1.p1 TRINITY_DN14604_c0_g4~~TRINITY_DN14604_c0_g4_i1.p1  ORF type:complete len:205 (-),score=37.54 TRINITY_DN14604_c0_g4_i1:1-615(-)
MVVLTYSAVASSLNLLGVVVAPCGLKNNQCSVDVSQHTSTVYVPDDDDNSEDGFSISELIPGGHYKTVLRGIYMCVNQSNPLTYLPTLQTANTSAVTIDVSGFPIDTSARRSLKPAVSMKDIMCVDEGSDIYLDFVERMGDPCFNQLVNDSGNQDLCANMMLFRAKRYPFSNALPVPKLTSPRIPGGTPSGFTISALRDTMDGL